MKTAITETKKKTWKKPFIITLTAKELAQSIKVSSASYICVMGDGR